MKPFLFFCIALAFLSAKSFAQENYRGGIVYGPKAAFHISAPEGWVHVTTAWEAIEELDSGRVVELSLDHDLGDDERYGRGVDVVDFIAEQQETRGRDLWPRDGITLHTANAYGRDAMTRAIRRYASKIYTVHEGINATGKRTFRFDPKATT